MSWSWSRRLSETVQSQEVKVRSQKKEMSFVRKMLNYISSKKKEKERENEFK